MQKGNRKRWFLKAWRKHRGLTQEQLAERSGLSKPFISQLETGKRQYMQDVLELLADALRCDPVDLIMRDPTETESLWTVYERLAAPERKQAVAVIKALKGSGTGTDG